MWNEEFYNRFMEALLPKFDMCADAQWMAVEMIKRRRDFFGSKAYYRKGIGPKGGNYSKGKNANTEGSRIPCSYK